MAAIKYKIHNNEVTIPLFEELDTEKTIRVNADNKVYFAGLTSNLADSEATALRIKNGGTTYAFLKSKPKAIRITDDKYRLSAFYPSTYTTIETVPDILLGSENLTHFTEMFKGCKSLKNVPVLDTSSAGAFEDMFNGCCALP